MVGFEGGDGMERGYNWAIVKMRATSVMIQNMIGLEVG